MLIGLLLVGCGGGGSSVVYKEPVSGVVKVEVDWEVHSYEADSRYGGTVDVNNYGFLFTSRVNKDCKKSAECSKADILYRVGQQPKNGRSTTYTLNLNVVQYDFIENPWVIIMQDWVRVYSNDSNGNNPITDFTLSGEDGKLYLNHKEHSGQFYVPMDSPQSLVNHGKVEVYIGVEHEVEIVITEGTSKGGQGRVQAYLDGVLFSDAKYQTKSPTQWTTNLVALGIYHKYAHNLERNPIKQIILSIENIDIKQKP